MQKPPVISFIVFAALLVLVAVLHLATPFLAALFCYLALTKLAFGQRKWLAVTLFLILIAAVFVGFVFFFKRALVVLPEIVETAIPIVVRFAAQHGIELPFTDVDSLRAVALDSVRDAMGQLGNYVKIATKEFVFLLIGIAVAIGVFLNPDFETKRPRGDSELNVYTFYTARIKERFASFYRSFATVMGAQIIISSVNATLTSIFVCTAGLHYAGLVVILTFLCGLLPIVGNLISNSIIIGIAFTMSPQLAGYAFLFLIVVHKLEYFLNSRIIGGRIENPMWLMLLALIIGERVMGIAGLVLAPVVLSFLKIEMKQIPVAQPEPTRLPRSSPAVRQPVEV